MKKWIAGIAIVVIVIAVGGLLLSRQSGTKPPEVDAVQTAAEVRRQSVSVAAAVPRRMQERISLHGIFSPWAQVNVVPKVPGKVAEVPVEVGQRVRAGDVLIRLETDELALQLKQAEAALAAARATLAKVEAGARPEEIEQAEAALKQAQAGYENARLTYERAAKLHEAGVMTGQEWDAVKAQYEVAKAQLLTAEKTLELVRKGAREEDLISARAGVAQAEAAVALAKLSLDNAVIKAPISGVVNQVNVQIGDMAGAGMPVVHLVDIDKVKLNLQVSEREVVLLRQGQEVLVTLDVQPDLELRGRISSVAPAASQTGLFSAAVELNNPDGRVKPGMYGTAHVIVREVEEVLAVPERAVFTADGRSAVYVVKDDTAHLVPVEVGMRSDGFVEIKSGLAAGDEVIVRGREFVTDQALVRVVERGISQ
ncbi:MAG TPA: efflux RND transporter periplasmic adaptor subunit [Firmicutes bacterium]|nr:efflux RND transporter periplasmic adaptor subunit [Bacillota bacterium]